MFRHGGVARAVTRSVTRSTCCSAITVGGQTARSQQEGANHLNAGVRSRGSSISSPPETGSRQDGRHAVCGSQGAAERERHEHAGRCVQARNAGTRLFAPGISGSPSMGICMLQWLSSAAVKCMQVQTSCPCADAPSCTTRTAQAAYLVA